MLLLAVPSSTSMILVYHSSRNRHHERTYGSSSVDDRKCMVMLAHVRIRHSGIAGCTPDANSGRHLSFHTLKRSASHIIVLLLGLYPRWALARRRLVTLVWKNALKISLTILTSPLFAAAVIENVISSASNGGVAAKRSSLL